MVSSADDFEMLINFAQKGVDDRTLAIILVSYIEKYLAKVIAQRMPGANSELREKIFKPEGILGSLAAKNDIARALQIISASELANLKLLGSIRNKFAHNIEIDSFDHSEISIRTDKFTVSGFTMVDDEGNHFVIQAAISGVINIQKKFEDLSPKERFEHTATNLCMGLHNDLNRAVSSTLPEK